MTGEKREGIPARRLDLAHRACTSEPPPLSPGHVGSGPGLAIRVGHLVGHFVDDVLDVGRLLHYRIGEVRPPPDVVQMGVEIEHAVSLPGLCTGRKSASRSVFGFAQRTTEWFYWYHGQVAADCLFD